MVVPGLRRRRIARENLSNEFAGIGPRKEVTTGGISKEPVPPFRVFTMRNGLLLGYRYADIQSGR
jgi:hypothetical protein